MITRSQRGNRRLGTAGLKPLKPYVSIVAELLGEPCKIRAQRERLFADKLAS